MIKTEIITVNGRQLQRTWSDGDSYIELDGARYSEAVDPLDSGRTYTETDEPIEENAELEDYKTAFEILTGVTE